MRTKVLILGLIFLLMMSSVLSAEKKKEVNIWQQLFTEPFESVYFIMKDGTRFRKTNNYRDRVYVDIDNLEKELKTSEKSYKIKDIAVIIHNHFDNKKFAPDDIKQYKKFKKHGFNGRFLLYSHITNKTYDIEDEEKIKISL